MPDDDADQPREQPEPEADVLDRWPQHSPQQLSGANVYGTIGAGVAFILVSSGLGVLVALGHGGRRGPITPIIGVIVGVAIVVEGVGLYVRRRRGR